MSTRWQRRAIQTSAAPIASGSKELRAQFDKTISPIVDLQNTVKQFCCAILCDSVRACAGDSVTAGRPIAKNWDKERRFVARIETTPKGLDVRYVVTSLKASAKHLYETP